MKEFKVEIPEGYEIDKEKSTFEKIVFKKQDAVNCWEDIKRISGCWINPHSQIISDNAPTYEASKNVFLNKKYAKSALALAQISQLLPYYDSQVDWNNNTSKFCIYREGNKIDIKIFSFIYHPLAFKTYEEAARFLKHNEQLVKDYYMLD